MSQKPHHKQTDPADRTRATMCSRRTPASPAPIPVGNPCRGRLARAGWRGSAVHARIDGRALQLGVGVARELNALTTVALSLFAARCKVVGKLRDCSPPTRNMQRFIHAMCMPRFWHHEQDLANFGLPYTFETLLPSVQGSLACPCAIPVRRPATIQHHRPANTDTNPRSPDPQLYKLQLPPTPSTAGRVHSSYLVRRPARLTNNCPIPSDGCRRHCILRYRSKRLHGGQLSPAREHSQLHGLSTLREQHAMAR